MKLSKGSRISFALIAILFSSSAVHAAQIYSVSEDNAKLAFFATGKPGFLKFKGEGAKLKGRLEMDQGGWKGVLTADLVPLNTGIDLRDSHMHDKYLETKKFPTAELNLESVKFEKGTEGPCEFTGSLAIKGVKKPIQGSCEWTGVGKDTMQVKASSEIKMADYPIGVPKYLGVTVADTVKLEVEFDAKRNPSG
jgi:polyisoprenoid-binding protein YceI